MLARKSEFIACSFYVLYLLGIQKTEKSTRIIKSGDFIRKMRNILPEIKH